VSLIIDKFSMINIASTHHTLRLTALRREITQTIHSKKNAAIICSLLTLVASWCLKQQQCSATYTSHSHILGHLRNTPLHNQTIIKQTSSKYETCIKHSLHEGIIKQTSSKHRSHIKITSSEHWANIEQLEHTSCTCILNAFAGCLLDTKRNCSMFAWSC